MYDFVSSPWHFAHCNYTCDMSKVFVIVCFEHLNDGFSLYSKVLETCYNSTFESNAWAGEFRNGCSFTMKHVYMYTCMYMHNTII